METGHEVASGLELRVTRWFGDEEAFEAFLRVVED